MTYKGDIVLHVRIICIFDCIKFYAVLAILQPYYDSSLAEICLVLSVFIYSDIPQWVYCYLKIWETIFCVPRGMWSFTQSNNVFIPCAVIRLWSYIKSCTCFTFVILHYEKILSKCLYLANMVVLWGVYDAENVIF
jgi:hypothetical protein